MLARDRWTRLMAHVAVAASMTALLAGVLSPVVARADSTSSNPSAATASGAPLTLVSSATLTAAPAQATGVWSEATAGQVTAHVLKVPGTPTATIDPAVLASTWAADLNDVRVALGAPATMPSRPIDGFLYPDQQSFMAQTGDTRFIEGLALPTARQFHVVDRFDAAVTATHELTHIVAYQLYGAAGTPWLEEGLAVAVAGWSTENLETQVLTMQRHGALIPIAQLATRFREAPGAVSYPEAGSFVRYLLQQGNRDAFVQMYRSVDPAAAAPVLYHESLAELANGWSASLQAWPTDTSF